MELFKGEKKVLKNFATVYTIASFNKCLDKGVDLGCDICILLPQYIDRIGEFTKMVKPAPFIASNKSAFVIVCKKDYIGYIAFLLDSILCKLHFFGGNINKQDSVRVTKKMLEEMVVVDVPEITLNHYSLVEQLVKMLRLKMEEIDMQYIPAYSANSLTEVRDAMAIELMLHPILERYDVKILEIWIQATKELGLSDNPSDAHLFVSKTLIAGSPLLNNVMKMTMVLNNINKLIIDAQK